MKKHDPYWQMDRSLGQGSFSPIPYPLRMRLHVGTARYFGRQEIVPITQPEGDLTSVHARPYTFLPSGLSRRLGWLGTLLRRVTKPNWERLHFEELGDCHAWYYHQDSLLILWDCVVAAAAPDPRADHTLSAVWQGFEQFLCAYFPDTRWIATPSWEPVYETKEWQAFLTKQGYQPFNTQAFLKEVHSGE
jgi:hypothetical protein